MIIFNNVSKTYMQGENDETTPIKDFSIEIKRGETVILNGPSGSGKSTLLNILAGLMKPTEGFVEIDRKVISKLPEHFSAQYRREHIGMIFQQYNLIESMTVADNIAIPLLPSSMHHKDIAKKVASILDKLHMGNKANMLVERLSGGEMQRTAIGRALINDPDIILADEPTANLDAHLTTTLLDIFKMLKSEGKTLLIATHDSAVTTSGIADRVITMSKGF